MHAPPSGRQSALDVPDQQGVVTEVGAGLRGYRVAGTQMPTNGE